MRNFPLDLDASSVLELIPHLPRRMCAGYHVIMLFLELNAIHDVALPAHFPTLQARVRHLIRCIFFSFIPDFVPNFKWTI